MKTRSAKNVYFCLLIAACCLLGNSPAQENGGAESPQQPESNHENISADETERVRSMIRSVVRVLAATSEGVKTGTGFFVGNHGELVTNAHVVAGAYDVRVFVTSPDGKSAKLHKAHPVRMDVENDLFLVKVDGDDLPPSLPLSQGETQVLDDVIAIGFPGSLDVAISDSSKIVGGYTDSTDVLENLVPNITKGAVTKGTDQRITHDAKISKGNSGGPLVSTHTGKVIGVNVAGIVDSMSTFYLAVPVKQVHNLLSRQDSIIDSIEWKALAWMEERKNVDLMTKWVMGRWSADADLGEEPIASIEEKQLQAIKKELLFQPGDKLYVHIQKGSKKFTFPVKMSYTSDKGDTNINLSPAAVLQMKGARAKKAETEGNDNIRFYVERAKR